MTADDFLFIWDNYRELVAKYIHSRIRYETSEAREDLVQEVYARAWSAMRRGFGPSRHRRGWLMRITHNLIVDYWRERGKEPAMELFDAIDRLGAFEDDHAGTMMEQHTVQRACRRLIPRHAVCIMLQLDGYTYAEIAVRMGASETAIRAMRHRALGAMRKQLEAW